MFVLHVEAEHWLLHHPREGGGLATVLKVTLHETRNELITETSSGRASLPSAKIRQKMKRGETCFFEILIPNNEIFLPRHKLVFQKPCKRASLFFRFSQTFLLRLVLDRLVAKRTTTPKYLLSYFLLILSYFLRSSFHAFSATPLPACAVGTAIHAIVSSCVSLQHLAS